MTGAKIEFMAYLISTWSINWTKCAFYKTLKVFQIGQKRLNEIKTNDVKKREKLNRFENRLKIWYKSSSPYDIFKGNDTSSIISISN